MFFDTTVNLHHVTLLPPGTTFASALATLQDHDMLIHLDPELAHYETLQASPDMPPNTKRYKVTDHMHTLPKGLWDTTVTFESQITNTDDGVDWVIKAPLGLLQKTTWKVIKSEDVEKRKDNVAEEERKNGKGKSEWCLVEDVEIKASRLLVGTVKGKCEENWRGVHARFIKHLEGKDAGVKA